MHFRRCQSVAATRQECILKIEFGTTDTNPIATIEPAKAKKHGWLPILVVLFLISYGLMTMLIVEQGRTIDSQRTLIRELFHDSTELSAVKLKAQQDAQTQAAKNPSSQAPTAVAPSTQVPTQKAPSKQSPSSQAVPQNRAQNQRPKSQIQVPARPASDINDAGRSVVTI